MRFYTNQHQYYYGIDLYTKNMYVCILDKPGKILVDKTFQLLHKKKPRRTSPDLANTLAHASREGVHVEDRVIRGLIHFDRLLDAFLCFLD
jgi:predicted NBD/HSP70 family sugar kinase